MTAYICTCGKRGNEPTDVRNYELEIVVECSECIHKKIEAAAKKKKDADEQNTRYYRRDRELVLRRRRERKEMEGRCE
jgi:hypothetical protein